MSLKKDLKFLIDRPNLFSALPVDIFLWVFASIFGFSLKPIETFFFNFFAILSISFASLSDSQLISKIFLFIAISSSSSVLPTPEKTILFDLIPAFKAFNNSPTETTSAPAPSFPKILSMETLLFDLAAKQTIGFVFLKVFVNFK